MIALLHTPIPFILIILKSLLCVPLLFFSGGVFLYGYHMLWLGFRPQHVCVFCPCVHHSFLRTSMAFPLFFPRDFPFPSLPTSCSPICSKKTGCLSCLLASIISLFVLPAVDVGSLVCFPCDLKTLTGKLSRTLPWCSSCPAVCQTNDPGVVLCPWTMTVLWLLQSLRAWLTLGAVAATLYASDPSPQNIII